MSPAEADLVLDTSVVLDFFGGDPELERILTEARTLYLPVMVLAELVAGARRSRRTAANMETVERFVARTVLLPCDYETAIHYADLWNRLRARGKPIPQNDMWIAAVASQHGLPLATRDAHFNEVDSLARVTC